MSTKSRESSGSSGATSVKWDETGLQTVKEICRKDKEDRSRVKEKEKDGKEKQKSKKFKSVKSEKDSTRNLSGLRRRTPLGAISPGALSERKGDETEQPPLTPVLRIEAAIEDEHEDHEAQVRDAPVEIPVKRMHRPVSEYPFGQSRSKATYEADDGEILCLCLTYVKCN